jgi:hypothetical protein
MPICEVCDASSCISAFSPTPCILPDTRASPTSGRLHAVHSRYTIPSFARSQAHLTIEHVVWPLARGESCPNMQFSVNAFRTCQSCQRADGLFHGSQHEAEHTLLFPSKSRVRPWSCVRTRGVAYGTLCHPGLCGCCSCFGCSLLRIPDLVDFIAPRPRIHPLLPPRPPLPLPLLRLHLYRLACA